MRYTSYKGYRESMCVLRQAKIEDQRRAFFSQKTMCAQIFDNGLTFDRSLSGIYINPN